MDTSYLYLSVALPGTSDPKLHLTLALFPASHLTDAVTQDLETLAQAILPLTLTLGAKAMFGAQHNVPVRLVTLEDEAKNAQIEEFNGLHHRPPPSDAHRDSKQVLHVTTVNLGGAEADQLTTLTGKTMALRVLGDKSAKPVWSGGSL